MYLRTGINWSFQWIENPAAQLSGLTETLQLTHLPDVSRLIRSETRRIICETKRVDRRGPDCPDIWIRFAVIRRLRAKIRQPWWKQRRWPVVATDRSARYRNIERSLITSLVRVCVCVYMYI